MKLINKLVRDNIPDICKENGQIPNARILNDAEYLSELRRKLQEEVQEYLSGNDIEELADVMEVIEALAEHQGCSFDELMKVKQKKRSKNGAFRQKIYLMSVSDHNMV